MKKRIAVLYIATGRYIVFWKNFYKSCEKYFLKDYQKFAKLGGQLFVPKYNAQ